MFNYLIRVHLADRPGALGAVASRIGSVGGDVVSIDILQRDNGIAVDELGVGLPADNLIGLLSDEILEVDGVSIESVRAVEGPIPDRHAELLDVATELFEQTSAADLLSLLALRVRLSLVATFASIIEAGSSAVLASEGQAPPGLDPRCGGHRRARAGGGSYGSRRTRPAGGAVGSGTAPTRAPLGLDHGPVGRPELSGLSLQELTRSPHWPPAVPPVPGPAQ